MKSKDFGPISNAFATTLFNGHTMDTLKMVAKTIKPELIEEVPKEEFLTMLIKFTASRELELLLNDYGIEKVAEEWEIYISDNAERLIESAASELYVLQQKLEIILYKFIEDGDEE